MMKVGFRCDGNINIGSGHVMRCLALAGRIVKNGGSADIISRNFWPGLSDLCAANHVGFVALETPKNEPAFPPNLNKNPYANWLGVSQIQDADALIKASESSNYDIICVDHYGIDAQWETILVQAGQKIAVIDDLANRPHNANMLVDTNLYPKMETRYNHLVPENCALCIGPKYAILREEFSKLRQIRKTISDPPKRVLVSIGGMDESNITANVMEALSQTKNFDEVTIVIGQQHPAKEAITARAKQLGFHLHIQTNNMAQLMADSDIAIGAGGTSTWERMCMGMPCLTIIAAENQTESVRYLEQNGYISVAHFDVNSQAAWQSAIEKFALDVPALESMAALGQKTVDGLGAQRILSEMEGLL